MYKVKEEYIDLWSNDAEWCANPVVTAKDIADFANGCGVSVDELMEQVEEIDMMAKYEICTNDFQIRCGTTKDSIGSYTDWELFDKTNDCNAYELRASFDTEAEAREFFDKNYKDYGRTWAEKGNVFWILRGRLAWIEINIYDENGEFDSSDGVIELSAEPYTRGE